MFEADRKLFAAFDIPDADNVPVRVDLTFPEFLDLYQKRFNGLSKKRDNIRMQRNKLYAHNDEKRIVNSENLPNRYPISYPDVQEMIDFALDCTGLILGILTDVNHATQYSKYMVNYLAIMMTVSSILCIRSKKPENLVKKKELWAYLKKKDYKTYVKIRYGILGQTMNLPGRPGRKVSSLAYSVARRLIGFN